MKIAAVIVAAGRGERAGQSIEGPKQYRKIAGEAILSRTLKVFLAEKTISNIILVIHKDDTELLRQSCDLSDERIEVVLGGETRQVSTFLGLQALKEAQADYVLIHDGVRPFISQALLSRITENLSPEAGILPALAVSDTLKAAPDGVLITHTVARNGLFAAQTPQAFPYNAILAAHSKAAEDKIQDFTDDSSIAEWFNIPVRIIEGTADNTKITWAKDIEMANKRLSNAQPVFPDVRTGNGYDVHAFEPGDHVILCGVKIPFEKKLSGHSDADVGLHALTDALLATLGAGDIGTHFPPSDPQWKGADSRIFLKHAVDMVRKAAGRITHADITLICEEPKIGPNRPAMIEALSEMLSIAPERISVKGTTNEKLGFIGRGEGIAAIVTTTVIYPGEVPE